MKVSVQMKGAKRKLGGNKSMTINVRLVEGGFT